MNVPTLPQERLVDENSMATKPWQNYFEQQQQNMQQALSNEGFLIPSVSSEVVPPATQSNLQIIQNSFGQPNGAMAGTIIFDPYEVNGGSPRNGQLKVLLNDGVFHPITNT